MIAVITMAMSLPPPGVLVNLSSRWRPNPGRVPSAASIRSSRPSATPDMIAGMIERQTTIWKLFLKFIIAIVLLVSPEGCPMRATQP